MDRLRSQYVSGVENRRSVKSVNRYNSGQFLSAKINLDFNPKFRLKNQVMDIIYSSSEQHGFSTFNSPVMFGSSENCPYMF